MKIGFNTSPLHKSHSARGTGTYTRLLLENLRRYVKEAEVIEFDSVYSSPNTVDILHYPFFDPFFLTLPLLRSKPTVVTVHDLIPLVFPEKFPRGLRGELKLQIQVLSLRNTSAIITDSLASKKDIIKYISYREKNVSVIYLAASKDFFPQSKDDVKIVRDLYFLPKKYALYVGDVNWNKNIHGLISAMQHIEIPLVLTGAVFKNTVIKEVQEIYSHINSLNLKKRIFFPGFIKNEHLAAVYTGASVYIQPSFAEGFGLPVLESMACGTPVVVSSKTSLSEIAGPSFQVDPKNYHEIADAVNSILRKEKKVFEKDCLEWARKFTWKKTAQETYAAYQKALSI